MVTTGKIGFEQNQSYTSTSEIADIYANRTEQHSVRGTTTAKIHSAMAKHHYFFKLIPPRPTFPQDMTNEEGRLMEAHSRYFDEHFAAGRLLLCRLLLYGPVMAATGAFGLAVLEVDSEGEAQRFGEGDPSVKAGLDRFEIYPMRVSAARAKES